MTPKTINELDAMIELARGTVAAAYTSHRQMEHALRSRVLDPDTRKSLWECNSRGLAHTVARIVFDLSLAHNPIWVGVIDDHEVEALLGLEALKVLEYDDVAEHLHEELAELVYEWQTGAE